MRLQLVCGTLALVAAVSSLPAQGTPTHDIVLRGGRVIDPASGLDGVRNVGIRGQRIAAVTTRRLTGRDTVDVTGLVVSPGFIDLHVHAQDSASYRFLAHDGVTTALDLEGGAFPVAAWYAERSEKALINYGAAVGHRSARIMLLQGATALASPAAFQDTAAPWARRTLSATELDRLLALLDSGLDDGALGLGLILQQVPAASHAEVLRMLERTARRQVIAFIHLRYQGGDEPASSVAALQEVLADISLTRGAAHVVHLPSVGLGQTRLLLELIERGRSRGLDVTTEVYPYTAMNQRLASAMFDAGWQERLGITYGDILWPPTGERLTAETFARYRGDRDARGNAIAFAIPDSAVTLTLAHPGVIVASDAVQLLEGRGHPRIAGTRARVLGYYVRERKALTLVEAIRKMSLLPAQRLEKSVPQMRTKGRIYVGADADLTIFDAGRVIDRATFANPAQVSDGIVHVLVGGTFVVRDERSVDGVAPGRPVRRRAK